MADSDLTRAIVLVNAKACLPEHISALKSACENYEIEQLLARTDLYVYRPGYSKKNHLIVSNHLKISDSFRMRKACTKRNVCQKIRSNRIYLGKITCEKCLKAAKKDELRQFILIINKQMQECLKHIQKEYLIVN